MITLQHVDYLLKAAISIVSAVDWHEHADLTSVHKRKKLLVKRLSFTAVILNGEMAKVKDNMVTLMLKLFFFQLFCVTQN